MMTRSSVAAAIQPHSIDMVVPGSYIELRSDDAGGKPWLARIIRIRQLKADPSLQESQTVEEVECEWLWHPAESIKDFGILNTDPTNFGPREIFLGEGSGETTSDWNPVDSIKYRVYILPLDIYKSVAAAGFQMQLIPDDTTSVTILDSSRCWYYRQTLNAELKTLSPPLELIIHRPNPEFYQWCKQQGKQLTDLSTIDDPSVPPRTILVPENPERMYFYCVDCRRRFETRQGDCVDPDSLDPRLFRSKDINGADIQMTCPYCKANRSDLGPAMKKARIETSSELWTATDGPFDDDQQKEEHARRETKRKLGRYERMAAIFKTSIDETINAGLELRLEYKDPQVLADLFFDRFDAYSSENQLNPKMEHQRLHEIFQNLKRENNIDLRRRIITGELTIDDLITADVKDLAPQSLKKRREAEQRKYFEQQVLLSASPESLRVIRKTHKGLEVVEDEDYPRRTPSPDVTNKKSSELDSSQQLSGEVFPADPSAIPTPSGFIIPPIPEIIRQTISARRDAGPPDSDYIDLPFPLAEQWQTAVSLHNDPQVMKAPEFLGVPNREKTKALLVAKLTAMKVNEKYV